MLPMTPSKSRPHLCMCLQERLVLLVSQEHKVPADKKHKRRTGDETRVSLAFPIEPDGSVRTALEPMVSATLPVCSANLR